MMKIMEFNCIAFVRTSSDFSYFCFVFYQVKRNVYDLTSIPVRHQLWEGWPPSATDDSVSSFGSHFISSYKQLILLGFLVGITQ